jgi:hypothetical protein
VLQREERKKEASVSPRKSIGSLIRLIRDMSAEELSLVIGLCRGNRTWLVRRASAEQRVITEMTEKLRKESKKNS